MEEEDKCDVKLAVGNVVPGEKIEIMADIPQIKDTSISNSLSALELISEAELMEMDLLTILPPELALEVFMFMDPKDLFSLAQTCHILRFLSEHDKMWEEKCKREDLPYRLSSAEEELLGCRDTMNTKLQEVLNRMEASFEFSRWKDNFRKHHRVLKLDNCPNHTCMEFIGNKLVFGSHGRNQAEGAYMDIWDPLRGVHLFKVGGHNFGVSMIQGENPYIISSSHMPYNAIKIWNSVTGECVRTLRDPTARQNGANSTTSTHLHRGILASGHMNGIVRLWNIWAGVCTNTNHNFWDGACINIFEGHHDAVRSVQYNGKLVASGSDDTSVKIWNPETNECVHTFSGHTAHILGVAFAGDQVVSSSRDGTIKVWDLETGLEIHRFEGYQMSCPYRVSSVTRGEQIVDYGLKLLGNLMVSSHTGFTVKIWDTRTWDCLQVLEGKDMHSETVNTIDFNSKFVVTGASDGKVKLWDLNTGHFISDLLVLEQGGQGPQVKKIRIKDERIACDIVEGDGSREIQVFNLVNGL